ncbi:MAG TPA: PRC-barrel domain containing protein [Sphingomicrobium sp.]|nr:PRC-barrel domain containing protein [Sphingomicrobium sp.]
MADTISWIATAATIIAACMTASNLGSRVTGAGFAVFTIGSIAWLSLGLLTDQPALTWSNAVLTVLNIFGVWRWLGRQARVEEGGRAAAQASAGSAGEALFPVSMLGRAEVRHRGQTVGACVDAMAGCGSGRIAYVVVSHGGIAGVAETLRKLPWSKARFEGETLVVTSADGDPGRLEELSADRWPAR